jgi:formylglycine-generating enzyme required for sulfatase activity/serine/threonine protein kinase
MTRSIERRRIRILLVEDNEIDVAFVHKLLSDVPDFVCEWDWAKSCVEAVAKFSDPAVDLCLLDYWLEDGEGLDLVRKAVALGCRFPIVLLTGEEDVSRAVEAIKAGATNYLLKRSLSQAALVAAIRKALPAAGGEARENIVLAGALAAGTTLFEYRLDRVLGHGGFGITYLAWDGNLDKQVAIKEYLPDELAVRGKDGHAAVRTPAHRDAFQWGLQQLLKEAKALARFSHPNLIRVLRFFEANGTAYFVTEYVRGETLHDLIKRESMLPEHRLRAVLMPVLSAVEDVHRVGVVHRDIKPANILMQMDGTPVLIDFGAARVNVATTRSVMAVYSAGYSPVEQYSVGGNQGPWTDIYALAAVAYTALSGRKPVEAINRLQNDPLVPAALAGRGRYTPAFLKAVDWGLSVHAEDRPRSVTEWRAAFGDTARPAGAAAPVAAAPAADEARRLPRPVAGGASVTRMYRATGPTVQFAAPGRRRRYAVWAGAITAVVLVAVTATWITMAVRRERPQPAGADSSPIAAPLAPAPSESGGASPKSGPESGAPPKPAGTAPPEPKPKAVGDLAAKPAPRPAVPGPRIVEKSPPGRPAAEPVPARSPVVQMKPLSTFQDCSNCPSMIVMPAGTYAMGSRKGSGTRPAERPVHNVTLPRFAVGRFEVTSAQWRECVAAGACAGKESASSDASLPVVRVNWNQSRAYAAWLSRSTGRKYRLPTESEWEFAARGGTQTPWFWGEDAKSQCSFANGADASARKQLVADTVFAGCSDGHAALAPVGSFRPNRLGLHDLAGNAWEWMLDCWRDSYDDAPPGGRPVDSAGCSTRVIRGGSWRTSPDSLRSAARWRRAQQDETDSLGFRVVAE